MTATPFFQDLEQRSIIKQITDPALPEILEKESLTVYAGFDPTSDSLHIGSLLPLLTLRRFQLAGHQPIAVVGGATGMIGDPSGKTQERSLLTEEQIEKNLSGIRTVIGRFLDLNGNAKTKPAIIMNNGDWFQGLSYIQFLRDVGKHFTVNHMVAKESVRARLEDREHGISYTEFSYMLLQAYDFYHLHRVQKCRLQIGGSDQWGNITAGIELIRRMRAADSEERNLAESQPTEVYGLTHPLVMKADGTKFGKTERGTIWLDPKKTSPYQFYQFFIQTADADVLTFLKYFTFLSHSEILALEESLHREPEKRLAQYTLAREVTRLVHGEEELIRAEKASRALFGAEIQSLDEKTLLDVIGEAPSMKKNIQILESGYPLIDALVDSEICTSKGAARKEIAGGGIYVNNVRINDVTVLLRINDLIAGSHLVLRRGKKRYHLISFQ